MFLVFAVTLALVLDNRRQGRLIRERYAQLVTAYDQKDTNAIRAMVIGDISPDFLADLVHSRWQAAETPGAVFIWGSFAKFWPRPQKLYGLPQGKSMDWISSNGVWYVSKIYRLD